MNSFFFFQFTYCILFYFCLLQSVILGVVNIGGLWAQSMRGGPWTRSMKGVHGPSPYFDGPGPRRESMDQGSMFSTLCNITPRT